MTEAYRTRSSSTPQPVGPQVTDFATVGAQLEVIPSQDSIPQRSPSTPAPRNFSYPTHIAPKSSPGPVDRPSFAITAHPPQPPKDMEPLGPSKTEPSKRSAAPKRALRRKHRTIFHTAKEFFSNSAPSPPPSPDDPEAPQRKRRRSVLSVLSATQVHNKLFVKRSSSLVTTETKAPQPRRNKEAVMKKGSLSDLMSYPSFPKQRHPPPVSIYNRSRTSLVGGSHVSLPRTSSLPRPASSIGIQQASRAAAPRGTHRRVQSASNRASLPVAVTSKFDSSSKRDSSTSSRLSHYANDSGILCIPPEWEYAPWESAYFPGRESQCFPDPPQEQLRRDRKSSSWYKKTQQSLKDWIRNDELSAGQTPKHNRNGNVLRKSAGASRISVGEPQNFRRVNTPFTIYSTDTPSKSGTHIPEMARKKDIEEKEMVAYDHMWNGRPAGNRASFQV